MTERPDITVDTNWPMPQQVGEPRPPRRRRAWGKVSHEDRYRKQRRDLLRAAARLATRNGYAGTRVADIVAEAGLSKSTFYEHFSSKEECFVELYRHISTGLVQAGVDAAATAVDRAPYPAILAVIQALVGYVEQDPRLAQVLRSEMGSSDPAFRTQRSENVRQITCLFETLGRRLGSRIPDDELATTATVFVLGVIDIFPHLEENPDQLDRQLEILARIACRSLGLPEHT